MQKLTLFLHKMQMWTHRTSIVSLSDFCFISENDIY